MEIRQIIGILAIGFFAGYVVVGAVHLAASHRLDTRLRRRTKGWLMPLLIAAFCCAVHVRAGAPLSVPQLFFVATLALYWAGDVLLAMTARGGKKFIAGGACFGVAHVLTIGVLLACTNFARLADAVVLCALAVVAAAYVVMLVVVSRHMRTFLKRQLKVPIVCYMAANAVMNVAAAVMAFSFLGSGAPAGVLAWAGAVCFFVSDTVLMSVRFNERSRFRTHTVVMATYLAAALLLAVAVVLAG